MTKTSAKILLGAVFFARGTSFLFSKLLLNDMSPLSILAVRFILAFLILTVIFNKKMRSVSRESLKGGLILGLLYTICMVFEMYGLRSVDSGVSSLIENMAIVMVPLYAAILTRKLPRKKTILCALLAVIGVAFLSITQNTSINGSLDLLFTFCAALTYGACIMATEKVSQAGDPVTIGIIQLGIMGVISLVASLCTGTFSMPQNGSQWCMLLILVLLCSCFGFTFQPVGQKYVPAETAAVFTVINPLTASVMGILVAGELMSLPKFVGYVLILLALLLYNLKTGKEKNS